MKWIFITSPSVDKNNPDSFARATSRAYDNGLVLRNIISTPVSLYPDVLDLMEEGKNGRLRFIKPAGC